MSATRKPAPSEVGAGSRMCSFNRHAPAVARFILSDGCLGRNDDREQLLCMQHVITAQPIGTMQMVEILDENWREDLLSRWKLQSGAPRQPTASPAKSGEGSHETKLPALGLCEKTFTQAQLNHLLDAMARRVVEEAANKRCRNCVDGIPIEYRNNEGIFSGAFHVQGCYIQPCWANDIRRIIESPEKLQQLREAVQKP